MSESKRKRLSLKSKRTALQSDNEDANKNAKKRKVHQNDERSEAVVFTKLEKIQEQEEFGNDDVICLSDEDLTSNQSKLRTEVRSTSLLDIDDEQLKELRVKLLELHRQRLLPSYVELPTMPVFDQKTTIVGQREATPDTLTLHQDQEYSPLPQMCRVCARRKPFHHDFSSIIKAALSDSKLDKNTSVSRTKDSPSDTKPFKTTSPFNTTGKPNVENNSPKLGQSDMFEGDTTDSEQDFQVSSGKEAMKVYRKGETRSKGQQKGDKSTQLKVESEDWRPSSSSVPTVNPKESMLSTCPLCTVEFEKGTSQVDIDGHIAVCLSAAGDDVMW